MKEPVAFYIPPEGGERLFLRPPSRSGEVRILVDPHTTQSGRFSLGTQRLVPEGGRIPVHRHHHQEEVLFIQSGTGRATLGEETVAITAGATLYIPAGVWHGVENQGTEPLDLLWVIAPSGLEGMFREIGAPAGTDPEPLSDTEFAELVQKHDMEVRRDLP
ncbi:MAG: cupin domain-containing protein [Armatimonadetes bacterium]|nr:cupin domain-containing protein [Armatimonadota bacterium]